MESLICNCGRMSDVFSNDDSQWMCWGCFYELPVIVPTEYWEPKTLSADDQEEIELPF